MLYNEKKPSGDDEGAGQRQRPAKGRMNMKVLLVIDQFDNANNGTTISARRFAETLGRHGNEVRVVSTGEAADGKYVVKELPQMCIRDSTFTSPPPMEALEMLELVILIIMPSCCLPLAHISITSNTLRRK